MGRKQTIFVNRQELLLGIAAETARQLGALLDAVAEIDANRDGGYPYSVHKHRSELLREIGSIREYGVRYDLPAFAGRSLTPSERLRHQEAIHALEAAGLVQVFGIRATNVKLTDAGIAAIEVAPLAEPSSCDPDAEGCDSNKVAATP
jgi:hypothetical protein